MTHRMLQLMLLAVPLASAAVVGLRVPRAAADANDAATLAHACEASHRVPGTPARPGHPSPTQNPAWQQAQRAAVERCLRDALEVVRTARAAN